MINLDFNLPLDAKTKADILVYLERRPLGEVYALFQGIVTQLTAKEANGKPDTGYLPNTAGSGDASLSSDSVPTVAPEQGSS